MAKRSFFERLTGGVRLEDEDMNEMEDIKSSDVINQDEEAENWMEEEGELAVDVYETATEIIVKTMVAGVRPSDLKVDITRDMITIKGKREEDRTIQEDNFFSRELYWGSFSRTIMLPEEVDVDAVEAEEKHGLLIIKLPKVDKGRKMNVKVKSSK